MCSASAYWLGCKAWFAANGLSPLQEAQHSRQACKPRPSGLSQQPALCVIRLRQAPACLQSDALNANCCASHSLQKRRPRGLIRTFLRPADQVQTDDTGEQAQLPGSLFQAFTKVFKELICIFSLSPFICLFSLSTGGQRELILSVPLSANSCRSLVMVANCATSAVNGWRWHKI